MSFNVSLAASPPLLVPLPPETFIDRECRTTVRGHLCSQTARNAGTIVTVPSDVGAEVVAVVSTTGPVAWVLNLAGDNNASLVGASTPLPLRVFPGDALIVLSGDETGAGVYDEAQCIVFVAYDTRRDVKGPLYCPPPVGDRNDPGIAFLRSNPLSEWLTEANLSKVPSVVDIDSLYLPQGPIDPAGWGQGRQTLAESIDDMRYWPGDIMGEWWESGRVPNDDGHKGYGVAQQTAMSFAALHFASTAPMSAKLPLVHALVQRGIDALGAACNFTGHGRKRKPSGGHQAGWKFPCVVLGHLWGVDLFGNPAQLFGPCFTEDFYHLRDWWFSGILGSGTAEWAAGKAATWQFDTASVNGDFVSTPPATWGDVNAPDHGTKAWAWAHYLWMVNGSALGHVLAAMLMGRADLLNPAMVQFMRQFMEGPPASARAQLAAVGMPDSMLKWGESYVLGTSKGDKLFAAAWRKYAPAS